MKLEAETEVKQSISQGTLGVNRNWKRQGRIFLYSLEGGCRALPTLRFWNSVPKKLRRINFC